MAWSLTVFSVVIIGGAVVAVAVGIAALRQRPDPLAWPLALLMGAVAAWAIPHAISFGYADVEWVARWHRVSYPGTVAAPVLYLVLALKYGGYDRWLSRRTYALLLAIPVATVAIVLTNPNGLFWRSLSVEPLYGASVFVPTYGPWYWVNLVYLYGVTAAGLFVFGLMIVRAGPVYRMQAATMFVGGLLPLVVNGIVNLSDVLDPPVDLTTTALAVSGIMFAVALFYLDLLEIRPVARERLVEELDDGVVVIGPDGRIQDFNPIAARIVEDIEISQPADEVLPSDAITAGGELVAEVDGTERHFRTRATTMTDERGREIGRIIYLNDVTDLVEREQRISVLNRVLRHNIRNELTVVSGHLDALSGQTDDERAHVEAASESAQRIVDIAEKARFVERTFREGDAERAVPVAAVVEQVVADARESYPDAETDCELDAPAVSILAADEQLFEVALAELVENAVEYNDRDSPAVTVRVTAPGADRVRVSVADDGPGIPEEEATVVGARRESPFDHASGIGLWLVKWFATLSDGDVSFEDNEPRGSVVTLHLRAAPDGE